MREVVHVVDRPGGILHLPDHDGPDLDRIAVRIVHLGRASPGCDPVDHDAFLIVNADGLTVKSIPFPEYFGPCSGGGQTPCYVYPCPTVGSCAAYPGQALPARFGQSTSDEAATYQTFLTPTQSTTPAGSTGTATTPAGTTTTTATTTTGAKSPHRRRGRQASRRQPASRRFGRRSRRRQGTGEGARNPAVPGLLPQVDRRWRQLLFSSLNQPRHKVSIGSTRNGPQVYLHRASHLYILLQNRCTIDQYIFSALNGTC